METEETDFEEDIELKEEKTPAQLFAEDKSRPRHVILQEEIAIELCYAIHECKELRKRFGDIKAIRLLSEELSTMLKKTGDDRFFVQLGEELKKTIK